MFKKSETKPWLISEWCIPEAGGEFVWHMEDVLDVYKRPYDPKNPVVGLDEKSVQLLADVREPIPCRPAEPAAPAASMEAAGTTTTTGAEAVEASTNTKVAVAGEPPAAAESTPTGSGSTEPTLTAAEGKPGRAARRDYEYERAGTANIFCAFEPLANWRDLRVTERRTKLDFAAFVKDLVDGRYKDAERIVLVMDNLNTHSPASLYDAFEPEEARRIARKLEIHYTPKHGSWLNVAEVELSVLGRRLPARVPDRTALAMHATAVAEERNAAGKGCDWQFATADARIKLKRLYPSIEVR